MVIVPVFCLSFCCIEPVNVIQLRYISDNVRQKQVLFSRMIREEFSYEIKGKEVDCLIFVAYTGAYDDAGAGE
jgi:hypothetical protein